MTPSVSRFDEGTPCHLNWSPAAPASSAPTSAIGCSRGATTCCASTTSSPARKANVAHLLEHPRLRVDAPRRDLPAVRRGRPRSSTSPARPARPLPARPGADDQDQRARRDQHAGAGQARSRRGSSRPRPARSTAIPRCIRRPKATGATSTRSAPRSCYDEGKRCAETLFFDYHRQHRLEIKVAASSTPTARACTRTTAAWSATSSCRRCGRGHHDLRRRPADAQLLLRRRPDRGDAAHDGCAGTTSPAR